jgi:hypothetical protein
MIIINKEWGKKVWLFLCNPITALAFSILLGTFFYFISKTYKSPSYYYTPSELIAKKTNEDLKILYENKEVSNIYFTNLILWNDGENYIDFSDFVKIKPIKFYSNDSIKILSVSLDKKSRKELKFDYSKINDTVSIKLSNDEALEYGDGVSFNVLFTKLNDKNNDLKFNLDSRIKGTKKGFIYKNLKNFKTQNFNSSIYILWTTIIILLCIRIITLYAFKKDIIFRTTEFVFIITLIIITTYLTIQQIFFTTNLEWI